MTDDDRIDLDAIKSRGLLEPGDAEWLIARLEAETTDLEAAERRADALEAECREERAQRQMAEAEVERLRETLQTCWTALDAWMASEEHSPEWIRWKCMSLAEREHKAAGAALSPQAGPGAEGPGKGRR